MRWIEVLDLAEEFAPRRWKRRAATAFIVGLIVVPSVTMPAFRWYIEERTRSITDHLVEVMLPTPSPTEPAKEDDKPRGRSGDRHGSHEKKAPDAQRS